MRFRKLTMIALILFTLFSAVQFAPAAEEANEFNASIGVRESLLLNVGKRVSVRITSGDPIEGTITKVGDHAVHLSKLSGRDYYDAIVLIDKIEALTFRAR